MQKGDEMRSISYNITTLTGMLFFAFLATSSFGSDVTQQDDETQQQPKKHPHIMASSEEQLPQDVRVYILSFLSDQKDLVRMGAISKSWRKAAAKIWENTMLDLSNKHLIKSDYKTLAGGIFLCLKLNNVGLDDIGADILSTVSHLRALELQRNNLTFTQTLGSLLGLPSLIQINLANNQIKDDGAKAFTFTINDNSSLTHLNLSSNHISNRGVKALSKRLTNLSSLMLTSNSIGNEGVKIIAEKLTHVSHLNCGDNHLGAEAAEAIAYYLTRLTSLNLYDNSIGDDGAKTLAHNLTRLTSLDLGGNSIGDDGTKTIASHLTYLTNLNLSHNNIGDEGTRAIVYYLTYLVNLNLGHNRIGDEGASAIAFSFKDNSFLLKVILSYNNIGVEGKKALKKMKQSKISLKLHY